MLDNIITIIVVGVAAIVVLFALALARVSALSDRDASRAYHALRAENDKLSKESWEDLLPVYELAVYFPGTAHGDERITMAPGDTLQVWNNQTILYTHQAATYCVLSLVEMRRVQ